METPVPLSYPSNIEKAKEKGRLELKILVSAEI
jgi:hypothetical protein